MSYILDALRKADAQRARDSVRGINAQGTRALAGTGTPSRFRPWYWAVVAVGVVTLAWAGWSLQRRPSAVKQAQQETEEVVTPARVIAADPPRPVLKEPSRMAPTVPVVGSAVQPPPVIVPPPTAAQVAQAQTAPPPGWPPTGVDPRNTSRPMIRGRQTQTADAAGVVPGVIRQQAAGTPAMPMQVPQQQPPGMEPPAMPMAAAPGAQANPPAPAPYSPPVAATAPPPPPVAGLPADAPKLSISGGVYSANRAQRMLIVNGQVFSEGSEISTGVVLEEVKPKVAVLRFRGTRYTVTY